MNTRSDELLVRTLEDFVDGKIARRAKLELRLEGRDMTSQFIGALAARGFFPATVEKAPVEPGERIPAFVLRDGWAYFGWVFWEKFSSVRSRKLFGSDIRNTKGDWEIQIPPRSSEILYANVRMKREMDIDMPHVT